MKLNLGCGERTLTGYVNIDLYDDRADVKLDLRDPLPYEDVEEIRAEQLIEHFTREEWRRIKKDWYKVLKPGGLLIIECPALDRCMENYLLNTPPGRTWWMITLYGRQVHEGHFHKNGFTAETLSADLVVEGFTVTNSEIRQGWNLHMEAVK